MATFKVKSIINFLCAALFIIACKDKNATITDTNFDATSANEKTADQFEIVKLTSGPKQHWFGYYDKLQVDPTGRYLLGAAVDTIHRSPTENDRLVIGMIDLQKNNKWIPLGESHAWGWQQGCMLQWIPGSKEEIIWNDLENGKYVSRVLNVFTKQGKNPSKTDLYIEQ